MFDERTYRFNHVTRKQVSSHVFTSTNQTTKATKYMLKDIHRSLAVCCYYMYTLTYKTIRVPILLISSVLLHVYLDLYLSLIVWKRSKFFLI